MTSLFVVERVLGDNEPSSVADVAAAIGVPTMVLGAGFSVLHRPIDRASDRSTDRSADRLPQPLGRSVYTAACLIRRA
jgi:hypothetical protein